MNDFFDTSEYSGVKVRRLFKNMGEISEGSSVRIAPYGGDPGDQHTHDEYDHLYIVTKGEVTLLLCDNKIVLKEDDYFLVKGCIPHSLWNHTYGETSLIDISIK